MAIKHSKVSEKPDSSNTDLIRPSDWNADHQITPDTIAHILSDHDKASHDALGINADTVDGFHANELGSGEGGVTNGDAHDHFGGDGAQIDHTTLSNIGVASHDLIDSHIADTENPHAVTLEQARTSGNQISGDIDFNKNKGVQFVFDKGSDFPADPVVGQPFALETVDGLQLYTFTEGGWKTLFHKGLSSPASYEVSGVLRTPEIVFSFISLNDDVSGAARTAENVMESPSITDEISDAARTQEPAMPSTTVSNS